MTLLSLLRVAFVVIFASLPVNFAASQECETFESGSASVVAIGASMSYIYLDSKQTDAYLALLKMDVPIENLAFVIYDNQPKDAYVYGYGVDKCLLDWSKAHLSDLMIVLGMQFGDKIPEWQTIGPAT